MNSQVNFMSRQLNLLTNPLSGIIGDNDVNNVILQYMTNDYFGGLNY